jgi:hypothetical protein
MVSIFIGQLMLSSQSSRSYLHLDKIEMNTLPANEYCSQWRDLLMMNDEM